ncbi:flagellar hook-basal body complex protein FliE [Paenibacillus sp. S-38]
MSPFQARNQVIEAFQDIMRMQVR